MEHTNCFLPKVQTDRNEKQPMMDPRAWLVKVAILRIELQQIDPTFSIRSLPRGHSNINTWRVIRLGFTKSRRSNASEIAMVDAFALYSVLREVERNDNLCEVLARAARSIRKAFLRARNLYEYAQSIICFAITSMLRLKAGCRPRSKHEYVDASESDSEIAILHTFHAFLTSVLHLLTSVFQYLIGSVDRGGSKIYSSGAFDFRDSFVALVLFQGAYVWIKFRQAARPGCRKRKAPDVEHEVADIGTCNLKGLRKRSIKNASGAFVRFKYEPRFTPPRQEGDGDTDLCSKRLPLGEYHTPVEAQIVLQIARHYYAKDGGYVELLDGRYKFSIPPMSELEWRLTGKEKRMWVGRTAKQVGKQMYADFERQKGKHLDMAMESGSHGAEFHDPSSSALPLPCSSIPTLPDVVDEPAIASAAPSSPSVPMLAFDGAIVGDVGESFEALSGCEDMLVELLHGPGLPNPLDQESSIISHQMHYQGFAQLLGDLGLPEVGVVPGVIEHASSELELNSSPRGSFQQGRDLAEVGTGNIDEMVFLPQTLQDLQQMLLCQKKRLEDNARQFVDLDHQLKAYQVQNLRVQQENESLKSRLEQVAKSQVATWTGIMMDIQHKD